MKIKKETAIAVFEELGIKTANKWNTKRMEGKLAKIDQMVDEDTKMEGKNEAALNAMLEAIENGEEITVTDEDAAKATGKTGTGKSGSKRKTTAKSKPAKDELPKTEEAGEEDAKDAKKPAKGALKEEADKTKSKPKSGVSGVREVKGRPYYAGKIIAKFGLENGVTKEMVDALDKAYGKVNPRESLFTLRNAWHAITAHNEG